MQRLFIAICIIITVLLIELQYFVGLWYRPGWAYYLGTIHWASDYFYYLSQMSQGREHILFSRMLYTGEQLPQVLVGWQNVLTGRIISLLGFDMTVGYQLAVAVYLSLFLFLSYRILGRIFPAQNGRRLLAFFLYLTSMPLPQFSWTDKGFSWWVYSYWYNTGNFFARFGPTSHHLLAGVFLTAGLLLLFSLFEQSDQRSWKRQIGYIAGLGFIGLGLASITPVQWGLMVGAGGLLILSQVAFRARRFRGVFLGLLLLFVGGIPAAVYVRYVFSIAPYSYSQAWESTQRVYINPYTLTLGSGLVIPLALIGSWWFVRRPTPARMFALCFVAFSYFFYATPFVLQLKLTNARFWPSAVYIFLAALAAEAIVSLGEKTRRWKRVVFGVVLIMYTATVIPAFSEEISRRMKSQVDNAFHYIPLDVVSMFSRARSVGAKDSVFLVQWPYNESFPALTGRKTLFGFYLLTIDAAAKERNAFAFFDGKLTDEEARAMLRVYGVDFVLVYPWTPKVQTMPFLKKLHENNQLVLYEVVE